MLLLACALSVLPLAQQPDLLPVLLRCEVRGNAAFEARRIRAAVATDAAVVQRVVQRAPAGFAAFVAGRAREGYLRAGFARARVLGELVDGVLRLDIEEGPRLRCGSVRVDGNEAVSTAAIAAALAAGDDSWREGEPAPVDQLALAAAAERVRACYRRVGRHGARCELELELDGERLRLCVHVDAEGREVRVQRLRLEGERDGDEAAVLARLRFEPGARYDEAFATDLQQQLERLGRYVRVQLPDGTAAVQGRLDPLLVQVELTGFAPPAAAMPWDDLAQVQRGFAWLQRHLQQGGTLHFDWHAERGQTLLPMQVSCTGLRLDFGLRGLALQIDQLLVAGPAPIDAALILRPDQILLAARPQHHGLSMGADVLQFSAWLQTVPQGEYMDVHWGVGLSARAGSEARLQLHPSTALYVLRHPSLQWRRDGAALVAATLGGIEIVRIGGDGELQLLLQKQAGLTGVALDFGKSLDEACSRLRPTSGTSLSPLAELATLGCELAQPWLQQLPGDSQQPLALLRGALAVAADRRPGGKAAAKDRFFIPGPPPQDMFRIGLFCLLNGVAQAPAEAGRLQPLLESLPALLLGASHQRAGAKRLVDLAIADDAGPLLRAAVAVAMHVVGADEVAADLRELAAQDCRFEPFWQDLVAFADLFGARPLLQQLGAQWRQQPELQPLFADLSGGLPADGADEAACKRGCELLWKLGGGELLRRQFER